MYETVRMVWAEQSRAEQSRVRPGRTLTNARDTNGKTNRNGRGEWTRYRPLSTFPAENYELLRGKMPLFGVCFVGKSSIIVDSSFAQVDPTRWVSLWTLTIAALPMQGINFTINNNNNIKVVCSGARRAYGCHSNKCRSSRDILLSIRTQYRTER